MQIQWEKVPDRLDSDSLKCLLCVTMSAMLEKTSDLTAGYAMCCVMTTAALTMENDAPFKSKEELAKAVRDSSALDSTLIDSECSFLDQHKEYFLECTTRVLNRVKACPDKPYNKERR